jgi:long-chain fatty acid transport protein
MKAKGMGGRLARAVEQDSLGGANNPASMVWAGERADLGLDAFSPQRDAERSGAGFATLNGQVDSDKTVFLGARGRLQPHARLDLSLGMTCTATAA